MKESKQASEPLRVLSTRIPARLDKDVDLRAIVEGRTKQALVHDALVRYLASPVPKAAR